MVKPYFLSFIRRHRFCSSPSTLPEPNQLSVSVSLFLADFVLAFMWLTAQSFHWNPIERKVFPEKLRQVVAESEYPALDVVICTADPTKEPPVGVVNTALSVLAYDYPTEKLSVYISDDGGSEMTLYAFMECAKFAKHWIPYCKKHNIVDRAPEVYFGRNLARFPESDEIKAAYEIEGGECDAKWWRLYGSNDGIRISRCFQQMDA